MSPWQAIQYVGSGLSLVAFIVAAALFAHRGRLKQRVKIIQTAPEADRVKAIAAAAEFFQVDVSKLPEMEQARIVFEQIKLRSRAQFMTALIVLVFGILLAALAMLAMIPPGPIFGSSTARPQAEMAPKAIPSSSTSEPHSDKLDIIADPVAQMATLSVDVPIERVKMIMGPPISERDVDVFAPNLLRLGMMVHAFYYQYKYELYLVDYWRERARLGLYIQPHKRELNYPPTQEELQSMTVEKAVQKCGPVTGTAHGNLISATCGGSHQEQYTYYKYFFDIIFQRDLSPDKSNKCVPANLPKSGVDVKACPNLSNWVATGIAISKEKASLDVVGAAVLQDMDHGDAPFTWPSGDFK